MPEDKSWIKLYRKIKDNDLVFDFTALGVFIYLLTSVDRTTGQYTTGRYILAKLLRQKPGTIYSALKRLEKKYHVISISSNNKFSTISILKWNIYQESSTQASTSTQHQLNNGSTLNKNIENIENTTKVVGKPQVFGNSQINLLLEEFKKAFKLSILDDTEKTNRRYAHLAIKKFGLEMTKQIIFLASHDPFWSTNMTSFKSLYYNGVNIYNKNTFKDIQTEKHKFEGFKV